MPQRFGELILGALSRAPGPEVPAHAVERCAPGQELALLRKEFEGFSALVAGKRVADFGCGTGEQSIALARDEGCEVVGIDTNANTLASARANAAKQTVRGSVQFVEQTTPEMAGTFDVVITQNAMEHFPDPAAIIEVMKALLRPDGVLLITFGPPWYAPYGSHMQYFCSVPWLNLLFAEHTVMSVRARYRTDGARRYVEVESGLNQMTLAKFDRIMAQAGLEMRYVHYACIKGLDFLASVPLARELFVNHVSCVLAVQAATPPGH